MHLCALRGSITLVTDKHLTRAPLCPESQLCRLRSEQKRPVTVSFNYCILIEFAAFGRILTVLQREYIMPRLLSASEREFGAGTLCTKDFLLHGWKGEKRRSSIYLILLLENLAGSHVLLIHRRHLGLCRSHLVHHSSDNKENDQVHQPETFQTPSKAEQIRFVCVLMYE